MHIRPGWKTTSGRERQSLEAAGFTIFSPEEGFYPHVNVLQVSAFDDGDVEERNGKMNWGTVEPVPEEIIPEEIVHGVNASFVELRLAVQHSGVLEKQVMYNGRPAQSRTRAPACSKLR